MTERHDDELVPDVKRALDRELLAYKSMIEARVRAEKTEAELATLRRGQDDAHAAFDTIGAPREDGGGTLTLTGRAWALSNRWAAEHEALEQAQVRLRGALAAICDDAVGGELEPLWIVQRGLIRRGIEILESE